MAEEKNEKAMIDHEEGKKKKNHLSYTTCYIDQRFISPSMVYGCF